MPNERRRTLCAAAGILAALSVAAAGAAGAAESAEQQQARQILDATGTKGGLIVHLGCGDGKLTAALRANERYLIHGLDADAADVAKAREHIRSLGLYGPVSVQRWSGRTLPYADNLVNLMVAEDLGGVPMAEVLRVLAPRGAAYVKADGGWEKTVKPWPADIDEWTHWLHDATGNAVARDKVAGPPRRLQWLAGPSWSRHHNTVPSVSAIVSANGRIFYVVDEAPPGMHGDAPDKWALVARDAFNGVPLWRIPLAEWGWRAWSADWQCRFTQPTHISRRLVAVGEKVYATLGFNAPLSEIDAATGQALRTFEGTRFTDEILHHQGLLIVSINQAAQRPGGGAQRKGEVDEPPVTKCVAALRADTGEMLWKQGQYVGLRSKTGSMERISHLTLTAGGNQVFFVDRDAIVSLDLETGRQRWRSRRPEVPEHKMRYDIRITDMCSLVYHDGTLLFAQLDPDRRIDWRQVRGKVHALDARTGQELWSRPCASWGWGHPADVFAVHGLVWVHDFQTPFVLGLDPATGQVRRKTSNFEAFDNGHHHRCYRNKATERYLMTSYRGLEFIDWDANETHLNHWVRGTCRLGAIPCNGLVYATPHPCDCYITSKLNGFLALAPASAAPGPVGADDEAPLEKGPAYGQEDLQPVLARRDNPPSDDWPTYRHDGQRSGATTSAVPQELKVLWEADVGGRPSACVAGGGKVFVASVSGHAVHALDARDGRPIWSYTAQSSVDTPPTLCGPLAIFGCSDGWVYCLRASDGELIWRFRAAPSDRLVGAPGGLESAWPVHGSVLARGSEVCFAAGRSSFLDEGILVYSLEARTGRVIARDHLRSSFAAPVDNGRDPSVDSGALSDLLVSRGGAVYMRSRRVLGLAGEEPAAAPYVRSTAGLLDDSWFNRTHWFLGNRPCGEYFVHDEKCLYGVRAYATLDINMGFFNPGTKGYELFATDCEPARATGAKDKRGKQPPPQWSVHVPAKITALVRTGQVLFAAGTPDAIDPDDPWAAHEGRRGGWLYAFSPEDGSRLAEYRLDSPPVFDGLIAANARLYLSTRDGRVLCYGGR